MIHKKSKPIKSLKDWRELGGPKRASHWVAERSAFETALEWLDVSSPQLPPAVLSALKENAAFGDVQSWSAEPEARIRIDGFRGEPRNCDLLVRATDTFGNFVISVEGKADEPFGETIEETLVAALERSVASLESKGVDRVVGLARGLFGPRQTGEQSLGSLRYQLLTATAGALAAAEPGERTVMLVEEFFTGKTHNEHHSSNEKDLNAFVHRLTHGSVAHCLPGRIYGPIDLSTSSSKVDLPQLFIGKVVHDRRDISAYEAVRTAMRELDGERAIAEVEAWIEGNLTGRWKDIKTTMADMSASEKSVTGFAPELQVLERVGRGIYRLRQ